MIEFIDEMEIQDKVQNIFIPKDTEMGILMSKPNDELFDGTYVHEGAIKITNSNFVPGKYVTVNNTPVFIKHKEGEPDLYKELKEANDYKQLSVYEDYSNLVWEENLHRDYINNKNLEKSKEIYSDEYIKIAKGEVNEK